MEKKIKNILLFLGTLFIGSTGALNAQDGEALFKAKCNACHIMGKDGTGPNLQNVKDRWEGEEEYLYEWVINSPKVIAEGKSDRAKEVKDYSPTVMPIQTVNKEEAKAIIEYADTWAPPAPMEETEIETETKTVFVPDYDKNLTLFYVLLSVIAFLLLAIFIVSKSTSVIIQSDVFKQKIVELHKKQKNSQNGAIGLILLIVFSGFSTPSMALTTSVPDLAVKKNLWLYVENGDLYILLIIAILLLGFLLHMVRMFYRILRMVKPKAVTAEKEAAEALKTREKRRKDFTRTLTGATPLEEEHKIDTGHEYDGIRELDNPMPPWWLAGFFISIAFSIIYMFHYHVLGTGDLQEVEYAKVMKRENAKVKEYLKSQAMDVDETNVTLLTERADLRSGKDIFINNCAVCHKENGSGEVGPNLTDEYWIHGGDIKDIFEVIKKGTPKGMPEHQSKFNPIQIQQVASYVYSLEKISEADGGKPAEGDLYSAEGAEESDAIENLEEVQRDSIREERDLLEAVE